MPLQQKNPPGVGLSRAPEWVDRGCPKLLKESIKDIILLLCHARLKGKETLLPSIYLSRLQDY
jgi:hypothetical protein